MINKQVLFTKRPIGTPDESIWKHVESKVRDLQDNEFLIKNHYISLDPAMRGWMNDARSYIEPVQLGEVMRAGTVGEVVKSNNEDFKVGQFVSGWGGAQEYCISSGDNYNKIYPADMPLPTFLGYLGMPGMTAYFGILQEGKIKEGDIVLVSAAAGAVGSLVGQIAKIKGCRVIGIAGGKEKCDFLVDELGFDDAIDYKNEEIYTSLKDKCPNGIDVYFDNVGGEILDAVLTRINKNARIVICGAISQYNNKTKVVGPSNYMSLLVNRASMKGMVVFDYKENYMKALTDIATWFKEGKLKNNDTIIEGIENFHEAFLKLFSGDKLGKLVLKIV